MIETRDPDFRLLRDELFGPVVTTYVYDEHALRRDARPRRRDGALRADRRGLRRGPRRGRSEASERLRYAAGNFYVNDKPTGAVVGQQPFGGARASGTNDKAGSIWNLIRWVSPRTIKETFVPAARLPLPVPRAEPARQETTKRQATAAARRAQPSRHDERQATARGRGARVADRDVVARLRASLAGAP